MKALLRSLLHLFVNIFLLICKRNKRIVLCTGWEGKRFADNSRYVYLYLSTYKEELKLSKVIWIANDEQIGSELHNAGFTVYMKYSLKSFYYHLKAGYFLYDQFSYDFITLLAKGAKLINLWHGMPLKKFGLMCGQDWNLGDGYLLTCSEFGNQTIGRAFHVNPDHLVHGMYPRNYYLTNTSSFLTNEEAIYMRLLKEQQDRGKKILFYLPTFRKSQLLFLGESSSSVLTDFYKFLHEHGYFMLTKLHYGGYSVNKDRIGVSADYSLLNLSPKVDVYPFLKETDILITDYSSVLFDFLYLDRDIICYPFDLKDYQSEDRGLLVDYQSLPADIVLSLEELKENLILKRSARDSHSCGRKKWLEKCFDNQTIYNTVQNALSL